MYFPRIEENIVSINLVKTNGRYFNPNIHVVGEKSPIIVDIIAICGERFVNGIRLYESDKSINEKYLHFLFPISASQTSLFFAKFIRSNGDLPTILLRYVRKVSHCRPLTLLPSTTPVTTRFSSSPFRRICPRKVSCL